MKFQHLQDCSCGGHYRFETSGDKSFKAGECSSCGKTAHLLDPLSVSVVAERLLHRSKSELDAGDNTLAILIAAIAVETFLTRLFMKIKKMDGLVVSFQWPTTADEEAWEAEYPRSGGFTGPANFVSRNLVNVTFDEFVSANKTAQTIYATLPNSNHLPLAKLCQTELFKRRNRIAHWGYINSGADDAKQCHEIAVGVVCVLREMDRVRYANI